MMLACTWARFMFHACQLIIRYGLLCFLLCGSKSLNLRSKVIVFLHQLLESQEMSSYQVKRIVLRYFNRHGSQKVLTNRINGVNVTCFIY